MNTFYADTRNFVYDRLRMGSYDRLSSSSRRMRVRRSLAPWSSHRRSMWMLAILAMLLTACSDSGGDGATSLDAVSELPPEVAAAHTEDAALGEQAAGALVDEAEQTEAETGPANEDARDGQDEGEVGAATNGLESAAYREAMSICAELQEPMARTLGLSPTSLLAKPADVRNENWGVTLDGCQLYVESLGRDLLIGANHEDLPAFRLRRLLRNFGWSENIEYQKSGPGATTAGFERLNALCLVDVAFSPPEGMSCPENDPVTCGRSPLDLQYEIAVRCAIP